MGAILAVFHNGARRHEKDPDRRSRLARGRRLDRANARMSERDARRSGANVTSPDPVARLHQRADDMAASSAALKKLVDAADPLYKSLDDGQKRRLMRLAGPMGRAMGRDG